MRETLANSRREWTDGARLVLGMTALMWAVEIVNKIDGQGLDSDGIKPRVVSGLPGIVFAPFLHASFAHLIGNTIPFVVLGLTIALSGALRVAAVTAIVALVAGAGTWVTASSGSTTVGASGIVFGYATFLIARGAFNRSMLQLAVGAVVGVLFGGALLWSLVPHSGVSWQDHLFGGIGGVLAARALSERRSPAKRQTALPAG